MKTMEKFGCIIEVFGIKDSAEYDATEYTKVSQALKNKTKEILTDYKGTVVDDLTVFLFRDFLYVFTSNIKMVFEILNKIQVILCDTCGVLTRSALVLLSEEGDGSQSIDSIRVETVSNKYLTNSKITLSLASHNYAILFSYVDQIKALSTICNYNTLEQLNSAEIKPFINYYISEFDKAKYKEFYDIPVTDEFLYNLNIIKTVIYNFISDSVMSRKLGRFYIPLLRNCAKKITFTERMDSEIIKVLKREAEKNKSDGLFFDELLVVSKVVKCRYISGIELFFATFVNTLFTGETYNYIRSREYFNLKKYPEKNVKDEQDLSLVIEKYENSDKYYHRKRLEGILHYIFFNDWIYELIRNSSNNIPESVASSMAIKRYIKTRNEVYLRS